MERRCCVLGCLKTSDDGVKLHEFPFDNQSLLPIWIMATNRSDWLPVIKSRICDLHFSIDDYEDSKKNNKLKPNACPVFDNSNDVIGNSKTSTGSDPNEISPTNGFNLSDIDSDDLPDTPNTSDMKFSDDDSILSTSSSDDSNSSDAPGLDNDFISSLSSESELDITDNIDDNSTHESDAVSLSSSASFENTDGVVNQSCAVVLCSKNARNQFDKLFFINFPNDNPKLCDTWWNLCGHKNKFDPSFKICSIHFDHDDFTSTLIRRDGQLYRQTILKNNEIVPTLYLLPQEYTKFTRKRKNNIINENLLESKIQKKSTENERCIVKNCDKSFLEDGKTTLFFKFPIEDKLLHKKWLDNIELSNWQPLETDRICSDHFENNYVKLCNNVYDLDKNAIPLIKPKNPFVMKFKEHHNKKYKYSVTNDRVEFSFNHLNLKKLNEDEIIIEEEKIKSNEENENILVDSLDDKEEDKLPKLCSKTPEIATILPNLTITNNTSDNETVNVNLNAGDIDLEYVYLDILDDENDEIRSINNTDNGLRNEVNEIKIELKTKENLTNVSVDVSNVTTSVNHVSSKKSISKSTQKKQITSAENSIFEETILVPKSKNNGNYRDYIYLDMLNGNDVGDFLSFEKKCAPKKQKNKIPKLIEKSYPQVTPECIMYNQDLTECYGEMLPAYCNSDCQLICYYSIPGPQRRVIYQEFQMLHNVTEQNCKITQLVQLRMVKNRDGTFNSCPLYHLIMNTKLIKVCRTFFINTLGISEHRIDAVLKPMNYSWYSDRDTALKSNQPKQVKVIGEPTTMTNFIKESSIPLDKDYNLYESESDTEVKLDAVPFEEYEKVFLYMKSVPRILSSYIRPENKKKHYFETTICLDYMYKTYSENYIMNNNPPPFTKSQFKKIYNQYMKTFLIMG